MIYKSKFINTSRCGAGFPWLLAHPTPTCILGHPQLHGPAAGMDIYIPLRYWNTSTWVPYSGIHIRVHPDIHADLNTYQRRCGGNLAPPLWIWQTPGSTTGWITTTGVQRHPDRARLGGLSTSMVALATGDIGRCTRTGLD